MGENLWRRARANINAELKIKVVRNTCDKELGGEIIVIRNGKSLEGSLDRVLFAAELELPKILFSRLSQHTLNQM